MEPRNILFITLDQWRADALACAGNAAIHTPHIDALAADGVLFAQHYANASPCAPSRAALLTGMYQHNNGVVRNGSPLDPRFSNVAWEARKVGLTPALFGYTDTAADPRTHHANDPAMHTYESVLPGMEPVLYLPEKPHAWLAHLQRMGYAVGTDMQEVYRPKTLEGAAPATPSNAPTVFAVEHSISHFMTDAIMDYVGVRRHESWFVHASYIRPHPPFIASAPFNTQYAPDSVPALQRAASPELEAEQHPLLAVYLQNLKQSTFYVGGQGLVKDLSAADLAQVRATYYGMVSEVDVQVGRLVQHLKDTGQYANTLIVLTSDHGEMLGDHHLLGKEGYFKEAYHVPLIVRDPKAQADATRGQRFDGFTEAVDVMPTILQWLGQTAPRQCDGHSLLPICHGQSPVSWRQAAHWEFDFRSTWTPNAQDALGLGLDDCGLAVMRDHDFQYVHFAALQPLLFDLHADPHCLRNVAAEPEYATVVLRYAQAMLSWRMRSNARALTGQFVGPTGLVTRA